MVDLVVIYYSGAGDLKSTTLLISPFEKEGLRGDSSKNKLLKKII
jgi:hypothetical protein